LENDQSETYKKIKLLCGDTPLFIGFGIQSKEDVLRVQSVVDGAIIGSAYLKALAKNQHQEYLDGFLVER
jgi:tryptophan synthase alpha chain